MTGDKTLPLTAQRIIVELLADGCRGDPLVARGLDYNDKRGYRAVTFDDLHYKINPDAKDDEYYQLFDDDYVLFDEDHDWEFGDDPKFPIHTLVVEGLDKRDWCWPITPEFRWNPYALLELAMVNKLFYAGLMSDEAWARFNVYNVKNVAQHFIASRKSRQPDTALYDTLYELRADCFACEHGAIGCCDNEYPGNPAAWTSKALLSLLLEWESVSMHPYLGLNAEWSKEWCKETRLHFAKYDGRMLRFSDVSDFSDQELESIISNYGRAMRWARRRKDDKQLQLLAVTNDPSAVQFFEPDRDVMVAALSARLRTRVYDCSCCRDLVYDGDIYVRRVLDWEKNTLQAKRLSCARLSSRSNRRCTGTENGSRTRRCWHWRLDSTLKLLNF